VAEVLTYGIGAFVIGLILAALLALGILARSMRPAGWVTVGVLVVIGIYLMI
jgi:hypothetical protein